MNTLIDFSAIVRNNLISTHGYKTGLNSKTTLFKDDKQVDIDNGKIRIWFKTKFVGKYDINSEDKLLHYFIYN